MNPDSGPRTGKRPARHRILHAAGYLTTVGIAIVEALEMPAGPRLYWTLGLLAALAGGLAVVFETAYGRSRVAFVGGALAASALVVGVMVLGSYPLYGAILFFVVITVVAMRLPPGATIAWVVGALAALSACQVERGAKDWIPSTVSFGVGYFAFAAFSVAFKRSMQARAESEQLLAELQRAQGRLRDLAVMEERQRLAREMHDAVGHRLTAAAVLLEGAARLIPADPSKATRMVETSRLQVREGLDELRGAVSALNREEPAMQALPDVLRALADVFSQGSGASVALELAPGLPEPGPGRKLTIVRTAQEALTNVQKHASATRVELSLQAAGGAWVLTCRDNGRGIQPPSGESALPVPGGYGLRNLRARAAAFGGSVDLESVPEGGTLLRLTLPLGEEADGA